MVDISSVQAFNHEMPWESKVLTNFNRFLIDYLRSEILSYAAVVNIAEFILIVLMVEQIVNIDIVNISLDSLQVNIIFIPCDTSFPITIWATHNLFIVLFTIISFAWHIIVDVVIFFFFIGIALLHFIRFF